jgi:hypothetical protein
MQVYYYKVLGRLPAFVLPKQGAVGPKLPGDILEVDEVGHAFIQKEEFPYKRELLLVGATSFGEPKAAEEEQEEVAALQVAPSEDAQVVAEVIDAEAPLKMPPAGAKVAEVLAYLKALEAKGYVPETLEQLRQRFNKSPRVLQELDRLQQAFVEGSMVIEG